MKTLRYILSALMVLITTAVYAAGFQSASSNMNIFTNANANLHSLGSVSFMDCGSLVFLSSHCDRGTNGTSVSVPMFDTSSLRYSGFQLPVAAISGVTTAEDINPARRLAGPRREPSDPFGGEDIGGTENPDEPGSAPLGDAIGMLLLLALGYGIFRSMRKERHLIYNI